MITLTMNLISTRYLTMFGIWKPICGELRGCFLTSQTPFAWAIRLDLWLPMRLLTDSQEAVQIMSIMEWTLLADVSHRTFSESPTPTVTNGTITRRLYESATSSLKIWNARKT